MSHTGRSCAVSTRYLARTIHGDYTVRDLFGGLCDGGRCALTLQFTGGTSLGSILILQLEGREVPVNIQRSDTIVSAHTGADLYNLEGTVRIADKSLHDWWMEALKRQPEDGIASADITTTPSHRWKVRLRQWSSSGERYSYTLELRQIESWKIDALVVDGIEMYPHQYTEEAGTAALRIDAKVKVSEEDSERLLKRLEKRGYFPVVRRGIQDEPREMRFGMVNWSENEGEIKYNLVLVEKSPEDERPQHQLGIADANARAHLAFEIALRRELFTLLQSKGVLSEEEIAGLERKAEENEWRIQNGFYRVKDVDLLP
jgi:hypothetical protein